MATPSVLVIGGPQDEHIDQSNVDRIGSDFFSVLNGAPRPYYDYDFVVYWPGTAAIPLPRTRKEWTASRNRYPMLPDIPPAFWNTGAKDPWAAMGPPIPGPQGSPEYDPCGSLRGPNIRSLGNQLTTRYTWALYPIVRACSGGQICVCALPPATGTGFHAGTLAWLSPFISYHTHERPEKCLPPSQVRDDNPVVALLKKLTPILNTLEVFRIGHCPLHIKQRYGQHSWEDILYWGKSKTDCGFGVMPDREQTVDIRPGHTNRMGDAKSLLFLTGNKGGIAVVPEPKSLRRLIDVLVSVQASGASRPTKPKRRKTGRAPASTEDRAADKRLADEWAAAEREGPGRLTYAAFASIKNVDVTTLRRALDNHRKRQAALAAARRR